MYKVVQGKQEIAEFLIRDSAYHLAKDYSKLNGPCIVALPNGAKLIAKNGKLFNAKECTACDTDGDIRNPAFVAGGCTPYFIKCLDCGGTKHRALDGVPL